MEEEASTADSSRIKTRLRSNRPKNPPNERGIFRMASWPNLGLFAAVMCAVCLANDSTFAQLPLGRCTFSVFLGLELVRYASLEEHLLISKNELLIGLALVFYGKDNHGVSLGKEVKWQYFLHKSGKCKFIWIRCPLSAEFSELRPERESE